MPLLLVTASFSFSIIIVTRKHIDKYRVWLLLGRQALSLALQLRHLPKLSAELVFFLIYSVLFVHLSSGLFSPVPKYRSSYLVSASRGFCYLSLLSYCTYCFTVDYDLDICILRCNLYIPSSWKNMRTLSLFVLGTYGLDTLNYQCVLWH